MGLTEDPRKEFDPRPMGCEETIRLRCARPKSAVLRVPPTAVVPLGYKGQWNDD